MKLVFSIGMALVVTSDRVRGRRLMRSFIILPMGLPAIFTITVWRGIFSSANFGLANQLLGAFGITTVSWLTERWPAFFAYNVTEAWLAYPFMVIITVSALQDVSRGTARGGEGRRRWTPGTVPPRHAPVDQAARAVRDHPHVGRFVPAVPHPVRLQYGRPCTAERAPDPVRLSGGVLVLRLRAGAAISLIAVAFIGTFMWINVKRGKLADGVKEA